MTEREKSLAGELYSPADPELRKLHLRVRKLFGKYNKIDPSNDKKLNKLIKKIFGKIFGGKTPFPCDVFFVNKVFSCSLK
jgi:maltose O-acetyltransferase